MRGYDAWKTRGPYEDELEIEWEPDFLEDSNEHHQCEECGKFLSRTPKDYFGEVDGDSVRFDFVCVCGAAHTVTSYPARLAPD